MRISDLISMCFRNLFRRKMRTLLTVIGVVIGTCAIVVTVSLTIGMDTALTESLSQWMDLTSIEIYNYGGMNEQGQKAPVLDDEVLRNQIGKMEHVVGVTPIFNIWGGRIQMYSGKYQFNGEFMGVYMDQIENFGYTLKSGRFPDETDDKKTLLFGEAAAFQFYNPKKPNEMFWPEFDEQENITNEPPIDIDKAKLTMTVTRNDNKNGIYGGGGVIMREGGVPDDGSNEKDDEKKPSKKYEYKVNNVGVLDGNWKDYPTMYSVYMDINFAKELNDLYYKLNKDEQNYDAQTEGYQNAKVRVDDMNNVEEVEEQIKALGFETYSFEQTRKPMKEQMATTQLILGVLGGVSLIVAAIGIANTMVMSIYERTREIGVMKVLGCPVHNIRTLFLLEAGSIGFIGGVIGIGLSEVASFVMNKFIAGNMLGGMGMYMGEGGSTPISIIPPWLIGAGMLFAVLIGLISGFYPANRAVKISALEAIKHE